VVVHGVHEPLERGIRDLAGVLGIAGCEKFNRAFEVGEEYGDRP
jgi:hypothetical protein